MEKKYEPSKKKIEQAAQKGKFFYCQVSICIIKLNLAIFCCIIFCQQIDGSFFQSVLFQLPKVNCSDKNVSAMLHNCYEFQLLVPLYYKNGTYFLGIAVLTIAALSFILEYLFKGFFFKQKKCSGSHVFFSLKFLSQFSAIRETAIKNFILVILSLLYLSLILHAVAQNIKEKSNSIWIYKHTLLNTIKNSFNEISSVYLLSILYWTVGIFLYSVISKLLFRKELYMTHEELKEELKESEGDPYVKSYRHALHQSFAYEEIIQRIKTSKVIIVGKN
jgi:flagellar biosynthesis protein FlhB